MDVNDLKKLLDREMINPNSYSLDGSYKDEASVLEPADSRSQWRVFYSERGLKQGVRLFETESDACSSLAASLLSDP